jgi:uncharacterized membrane protein YidH (DUF202 family)
VTAFDPESRVPGLAAERTDLAWNRSGLSLLACGAAILRGINRPPLMSTNLAIGVCVLILGAITWFLGAWYARRSRGRGARRTSAADLTPIAAGVAAVGIAAFIIALLG